MPKYKIVQDYNNIVTEVKFYKDEIVEGTPSTTLNGFINVIRNGKSSSLAVKFEIEKVDDSTPISVASKEQVKASEKSEMGLTIASSVGAIAGIALAYKMKKGVWGYIGFMMLGGILGSVVWNFIPKGENKK